MPQKSTFCICSNSKTAFGRAKLMKTCPQSESERGTWWEGMSSAIYVKESKHIITLLCI